MAGSTMPCSWLLDELGDLEKAAAAPVGSGPPMTQGLYGLVIRTDPSWPRP